jgi:threonine dehydratase
MNTQSLTVPTLDDIRAAQKHLGDAIYHSPCPYSLSLSRLCGADIYCKLDHLQMTGSFKERGARNRLINLTEAQKKAGVIAARAGNHALGLAYHGQLLGVRVQVVMPKWAPLIKITNCRSFGADVIMFGETYDEARRHALELAQKSQLTYVPGFDDPYIIAGTGTLGLEILEDIPDVDAVIVPVGGGGLIAGVGLAIKGMRPQTRIIGVEPSHAPCMTESLKQGKVVHAPTQPTLADGLAVAEPGQLCFEIAQKVVDQMVLVDEARIALSVLRLLELEKAVVEGAGAVPLAAAMDESLGLKGKKIVLLLCGGNIDVTTVSRVIERGMAIDGRLCRFTARVSDRPGSLAHLTKVLADTGASVKEVFHDRHFASADVARVSITCLLETRDFAHIDQVKAALAKAGIEIAP